MPKTFAETQGIELPEKAKNSHERIGGGDLVSLLWLILFGFGGGLLSMYYASIGYFPDIDWHESLVYLGVMTIVGIFLFVFYALLVFVPGWMWSELLVSDPLLEDIFIYKHEDRWIICAWSTLVCFALPFGAFMLFAHWLLIERYVHFVVFSFIGLVAASGISGMVLHKFLKRQSLPCSRSRLLHYVVLFLISSGLSFCSLLLVRWITVKEFDGPMPWVCTAVVFLSSLLLAVSFRPFPRGAVVITVLATLSLMILGDQLVKAGDAKLSARVMSSFGIGYGHCATMLIKNSAEETYVLKSFGIPFVLKDEGLQIDNVEILSRLGKEFFVRVKGPKQRRNFPLRKDLVISWAMEDSVKKCN